MKIRINTDKKLVDEIRQKIRENFGYCLCKTKSEDTKCMCKEFLEQEDGLCRCGLYIKESEDD